MQEACADIHLYGDSAVLGLSTFVAPSNDKSLVVYEVRDGKTNSTWRLSHDEDQVAFEGSRYCETIEGTPCVPCFLPAVYGRGNNTWHPKQNDTGQCAGVTLAVVEAYDCTEYGKQVPIFLENTCALNISLDCNEITGIGRIERIE